uniref:Uncharacterized protein n=1 Tax=Rhizophora mucronata TaxID=61149 RepID=A0A2P2ITU4_RHIMU
MAAKKPKNQNPRIPKFPKIGDMSFECGYRSSFSSPSSVNENTERYKIWDHNNITIKSGVTPRSTKAKPSTISLHYIQNNK